jgi:hypothetical protein
LFSQEIFLSRPDPLVRHFFGKSPEKTKSCAIIAAIHELSGLVNSKAKQGFVLVNEKLEMSQKIHSQQTINI